MNEKIVAEKKIFCVATTALHETPSMLNVITLELHTQKAATRNHNYNCAVVILFAIQRFVCRLFNFALLCGLFSWVVYKRLNGSDYDDDADEKTRISFPCLSSFRNHVLGVFFFIPPLRSYASRTCCE